MPNARRHAPAVVVVVLLAGPVPVAAAPVPASQPAASAPVPATQPASQQPAAPMPPAPAKSTMLGVAADRGWFAPGLLIQAWLQVDRYTGHEAAAGKDHTTATFRLRRAEASAKGEILAKRVGYGIVVDFARVLEPVSKTYTTAGGDTVSVPTAARLNPLNDVWVAFLTDYADVAIGQFKMPVSLEALISSSSIVFPERAPVALRWGDKRDLGLKVTKKFKYFGYYVGLFNGQGQNNLDINNSKDLAARLEAYPIRGLTVAGVVYHELKAKGTVYEKRRYEADLRFERGAFLFQGEYIYGEDRAPTDAATKKGHGFYTTLAYTFLGGRLQPAVRIGLVDPDLEKGDDYTMGYEVAVSWFVYKKCAKVQLAYARFQERASDKKSTNDLVLAVQGHF